MIAKFVCELGAGRIKKEDKIDSAVGIEFYKEVGDHIKAGENLATIYSNDVLSKNSLLNFYNLNFTLKMNKKSLYNTSISIYRDFRVFRFFL